MQSKCWGRQKCAPMREKEKERNLGSLCPREKADTNLFPAKTLAALSQEAVLGLHSYCVQRNRTFCECFAHQRNNSVPPCDANTHHEVWPTVQCYSGFVYTKSVTMSCVNASFHIFAQFHCPEEKAYSFLTSSGVKEFSLPNKQTRKLTAF